MERIDQWRKEEVLLLHYLGFIPYYLLLFIYVLYTKVLLHMQYIENFVGDAGFDSALLPEFIGSILRFQRLVRQIFLPAIRGMLFLFPTLPQPFY